MAKKKKSALDDETLLLSYRIRELREKAFPTAKEAAEAFGVSPSQWTNWEKSNIMPHASTRQKIADFFKVDIQYLSQMPENWETVKKELLSLLKQRAWKFKDRYTLPDAPSSDDSAERPQEQSKADDGDEATVFLEIAALINNAHKQMKNGTLPKATYEKNMKLLADLLDLATAHS